MNTLDLLIIVIVLSLAAIGYAQGFIIGITSLVGLVLGGMVGTRVVQLIIERSASSSSAATWAPIIGLGVGLAVTLAGAMAMQDIGARLRGRVQRGSHARSFDHALGAIFMGVVALLLAWFAAAAAMGMPNLRELRSQIVASRLVSGLNTMLPDAGPILGAINAYDPFPAFDGGAIDTPAPDARLPRDPQVGAAARSVVRVVGTACGYRITGSGWVAADGYVITNAHVVAGEHDTHVQLTKSTRDLPADVVAFDARNDVAVLRVADLGLEPLRALREVAPDTASVLLGYPENRGFTATATRFSDERKVHAQDIYGRGDFVRRVTSFRGTVRHGNSGGPVVDGDGYVLTTVFASTVGEKIAGGYGVPNDIAMPALDRAVEVPSNRAVPTGACIA